MATAVRRTATVAVRMNHIRRIITVFERQIFSSSAKACLSLLTSCRHFSQLVCFGTGRGLLLRLSILFPLVHVFCLLSLVYLRSLRFMVLRKVKLTLSWPKFSRPLILRRRGSVSSVLKSSRIPSRVFLLCGSDM